ncbi:MAG TPA: double-strand break repair protein AddB, partial [Rhizomicrobium sp.]|nr:double-strand break repair protein AddB [Rhizomicrobium sp.]
MANVFTIPASAPFAQALADALIAQLKPGTDPLALSRVSIFVPTRRAVRSLGEIFARSCGGAALLPDIRPLGDVDEDEHLFDGAADALDILPAISTVRRRLLLAALITRWQHARNGETMGIAAAARLAQSLGGFLDEVQTQGADLAKLHELADAALSDYWAEVRDFLSLLADQWPGLRDAEGRQDHVVHRDGALRLLAKRLQDAPPDGPVIAAGSTGSIPATAQLLGVIARLPKGAVILPGLDLALDEKSWTALDEGHPQFGMKQVLQRMGVERGDVKIWGGLSGEPSPREIVLRETLRPAPTTDAWRALVDEGADGIIKAGLEGLSLIEAADAAQEASVIGLMLREVLETPGQTAALVTPDRNLARRVAAEMNRWDISIDDSAGRPLARTAPGTFLCLVAEAMRQSFAPVALLALLKHPLASGGQETALFRRNVRQLDMCLRGPRPDAGLEGIAKAIAQTSFRDEERKTHFLKWFAGLAKMFGAPLPRQAQLAQILAQHVAVAEALAATDVEKGGERIWQGDAGQIAQGLVTALNEAAAGEALPPIDTASYA